MSGIWTLFFTFLKIGLFSIGGGYAVIPSIREEVVEKAGWISEKTFTDIITISQMTPGPLAVNTSTFVGLQAGGILGAAAATVGCVLCGVVISLGLHCFFQKRRSSILVFEILKGLKAASLGLIISAGAAMIMLALFGTDSPDFSAVLQLLDRKALFILSCVLLAARRRRINPILLMMASGAAGAVFYL